MKVGPKVEWYLCNESGWRAKYKWGQTPRFLQAGYPMDDEPLLMELVKRIKVEFGEDANHAILKWYADGMEQSSPPHQDKAEGVKGAKAGENDDMARDASFYVFSFGDAGAMREFTIQRGSGKPGAKDQAKQLKPEDIIWQKILANGSLLRVSAPDNREYHHALHPMKGAGQRWSLIFRVIKTFIPIEPDVAAEVNDPTYRFVSNAQIVEGRVAPKPTELTAFAKSQSSFRTAPQRKEAKERGEKIPGIPVVPEVVD